ncbi:MAG TPA: efflux RND transporter periplasmic adaptor subunit [Roseomonas sp.]|jgi:multidrug efflux system membrane fusion protein
MRLRVLVFSLVALGATALAAPVAHGQGASPPAQGGPRIPVTTDPARVGAMPIEIAANGTVVADAVVTIRPRVDGQIEQVHVREGQMVQRGELLFTLDTRMNRAILQQQEAQLTRDRALATRAQADAARYQSLRGEGFAAQQRFEQAQADAASAAANVQADEALIAQTRLQIAFASITAEVGGRLGTLPLREGTFLRLAETTALATITRMDPIFVQFAIPERWLEEVQTALANGTARVRVHADGDRSAPLEGSLAFVDSAVDTATGTITLKARFSNADMRLWPGRYVQVTLTPRDEDGATSVTAAAVQTGPNGRFVYVLTPEGVARRRPVQLLRMAGDRAVIQGEVAAGEAVIIDGAQRVTDGSRAVARAVNEARAHSEGRTQ